MRKARIRGRFPVEEMTGAVMNSELAKKLKAKVKERLARIEPRRVRRLCIVVLVTMLAADLVLVWRAGHRLGVLPHNSVIRQVVTVGAGERRPDKKLFGLIWDSMMADPARKGSWDSLLQLRPGLLDTVVKLERMDSVLLGK